MATPMPIRPGSSRPGFSCTLLVLLACLSSAVQAQVILTDTEFDVANDWTLYGPFVEPASPANPGSFTAAQVGDGGHPGAYLSVQHTNATAASGRTSSWGGLINEKLSWEPANLRAGAEAQLTIRFDARRPFGTLARALTLLIRQDGWLWAAVNRRVQFNEDGWGEVEIADLERADFARVPNVNDASQPAQPDFSRDASTVHVGLLSGLSCPTTSDCSALVEKNFDIDNLEVVVKEKDAFYINPGLNDAWYFKPTDGTGFFVIVYADVGIVFASWFTFDAMRPDASVEAVLGDPGARWFTASGPFEVDTAELLVYLTEGGILDSPTPPIVTDAENPIGSMTIVWSSCNRATLDYDIQGYDGSIELERVANDNIPYCEILQP